MPDPPPLTSFVHLSRIQLAGRAVAITQTRLVVRHRRRQPGSWRGGVEPTSTERPERRSRAVLPPATRLSAAASRCPTHPPTPAPKPPPTDRSCPVCERSTSTRPASRSSSASPPRPACRRPPCLRGSPPRTDPPGPSRDSALIYSTLHDTRIRRYPTPTPTRDHSPPFPPNPPPPNAFRHPPSSQTVPPQSPPPTPPSLSDQALPELPPLLSPPLSPLVCPLSPHPMPYPLPLPA